MKDGNSLIGQSSVLSASNGHIVEEAKSQGLVVFSMVAVAKIILVQATGTDHCNH